MEALLDTGCTKTLVHLWCVKEEDYLGWNIPYHMASNQDIFPSCKCTVGSGKMDYEDTNAGGGGGGGVGG